MADLAVVNAADVDRSSTDNRALATLADWIAAYVARPHEQLGRAGAVCPYVPSALQLHAIWLATCDRDVADVEEMSRIVRWGLRTYPSLEPRSNPGLALKTMVVAFSRLSRMALIDAAHYAMKPSVVESGLMLGEFYPGNRSPGVHSAAFRAADSPLPLFVLRRMVPGDLAFLNKASDPSDRRAHYLRSYLRVLHESLPPDRQQEALNALTAAENPA